MKNKILSFVTAITLLSFPASNIAQAPDLGAAANFVLFTITGAVSNTQRSFITGEVGTNTGAVTGFGNVDGTVHLIPDATTAAAAGALVNLKSNIISRTSTGTHAPAFGVETVLPGVYDVSGNAVLDGVLTLNGGGDPNALFIFRVSGAFVISNGSAVVLTNGAAACNVFWTFGGVVSLFQANMKGTILAGAAINISPGLNLEGRALTTVDAINVSQFTAYTPLGCSTPILTGPAAPDLLSTKNFGLFTGSGAMSDGGASHITGDVGSNTDNPSGFNPANVTGTIHQMPDLVTQQASEDLTLVYDDLNGRSADIQLLDPTNLGFGLVLTPHTYLLDEETTLHDTLFLNAQGNTNAVFILKVTGAFFTTTNAVVQLINGTQARNVYWKIDGAVDLKVGTKFAGTLVVAAGAIALRTDAVLAGRGLTMVGAVSASNSSTIMYSDGAVLPVTWLAFTGKPVGENVLLEWSTANELNNGFFTIQKGKDAHNLELLTTITAHGEVKNSHYYYSFLDKLPFSNGYYSISQTDKDGAKSFYKMIQVKANISESFKAIHYVQQNFIYVKASAGAPANASLKLFDLDGKLISSQIISLNKDLNTYKIAKPVSKGIYLIQLESNGTKLYSKKVGVL